MKKHVLKKFFVLIFSVTVLCPIAATYVFGAEAVLKAGDNNEAVVQLQESLISLGYLVPPADGDYGTYTANSVKAFQEEYGLEATGDVDENTMTAITDVFEGVEAEPTEDAEPVDSGLFRNVEINRYENGKYNVAINTVSKKNLDLMHQNLLAIAKAFNESEEVPEHDLVAALVSEDPEAELVLVRDLSDEELAAETLTVQYYDMDTMEAVGEPTEIGADEIQKELSYVFRNIIFETDEEGNVIVQPGTVTAKPCPNTGKCTQQPSTHSTTVMRCRKTRLISSW